jgi:hypothetical protein
VTKAYVSHNGNMPTDYADRSRSVCRWWRSVTRRSNQVRIGSIWASLNGTMPTQCTQWLALITCT